MKNFISKFIASLSALTLVMGVFSCNTDFLDPIPETSFSDIVVFDTPSRVEQQVNGIYDFVKAGQFMSGRFFVYIDIRGDNFLNETTNGVTGLETWRHSVVNSTNEVQNLWSAAYAAINRANLFLEGVDANASKFVTPTFPANFTSVVVPAYKAEARFLRALCYYSMVQLYCRPFADGNGSRPGLPIRLKGNTSSADNDLARSTVAEVYTQILDDLNFAEANLPLTYSTPLLRVSRAHRNAAIALKTRVYLTMGQYANVITEANKIVSTNAPFTSATGVAHALNSTFVGVFTTPYTTVESIFSMPFTTNDLPGGQNGLGSYYNPGPAGIGDFSLNPSGIFGNTISWPNSDARRNMTSLAGSPVQKPYLRKFPTGPEHLDYAPVIRYSEVLLNLAEAIARTTNLDPRSIALVNAVRRRSDTSVTLAPSTNDELISFIMTERNIELLGEGFRSHDFMRLLQTIPGKGTVGAVTPSAELYVWPIPVSELNANKLMTP
jgi:starch-binding outer membrane protein, SusD/RagB family